MEIDLNYIVIEMMVGIGDIPIVVGHQTFAYQGDANANAVERALASSESLDEKKIRKEIESKGVYGESNWSVCVRGLKNGTS